MSTLPTDNPTAILQQMHRWRMAFFGLVVLLAGMVIGGSVTLLVLKPKRPVVPPEPEGFMLGALRDVERHLTDQQRKQVDQIMQAHMEELRRLREEELRPPIIDQMKKLREDIVKVLTPEQRQLWDQRAQQDQREFWRRRGEGPGGGRMGPGGPGGGMRGGPGGGRMGPGGPGNGIWPPEEREGQRFRGGQGGSTMRGPGGMDRRFGPEARMPFGRGPNTMPEPYRVPEPNSVSEPNTAREPNTPGSL